MEEKAIIKAQFSRAEFDGAVNMMCLIVGESMGDADELDEIWKCLSSEPIDLQDINSQVFKQAGFSKEQLKITLLIIAICNALFGKANEANKTLLERLNALKNQ